VSKGIGILYKARKILSRACLLTLYQSFIYPYLSYSIHVWGGTFKTALDPLFILQKRAVKCICFLRKFDKITMYFSKLSLLSLYEIHRYELVFFMFKFYKGLLPDVFQNYFVRNNNIHAYNTRNANNLRIPLYRSVLGQNSFHYNVVKLWNDVGSKLYKASLSCSSFKRLLKSSLLSTQS
jgi:hypothetical protein